MGRKQLFRLLTKYASWHHLSRKRLRSGSKTAISVIYGCVFAGQCDELLLSWLQLSTRRCVQEERASDLTPSLSS